MKKILSATLLAISLIASGCSPIVTAVQTGKGSFPSTDPNSVEILKTRPDRPYEELGSLDASGFPVNGVAKLYNALRGKASAFGANAVIITSENVYNDPSDMQGPVRAASGVAIRFKTEAK